MLLLEQGRSDLAIGYIGKALTQRPREPDYLLNLGRALAARGHTEEARAAFHAAVLLAPDDPLAHFNLATALATLARTEEAIAHYRDALRLDPFLAEACENMGLILHAAGRLAEAETCFARLAALRPDDARAQGGWAAVLRQLGRIADSEAALRSALRHDPDNPDWANLLGASLLDLNCAEEAEAPLRTALRHAPDHVDAANNLGLALLDLGRLQEALAMLQTARRLQPGNPDILANLGTAHRELGETEAAARAWDDALAVDPEHAPSRFNRAVALLTDGDYAAGWPELEWRDHGPSARPRTFEQPRWNGEPTDQAVLIHAEQGFGDTLQFCRLVALAAQRARIVLEVPRPLLRLLSRLAGVAQIVARGDDLPPFGAHCPMLSMPGLLGIRLETIPDKVPYLSPPSDARWPARLAGLAGVRVGLCWRGSLGYRQDRARSLDPALLAPLAAVPGVAWVSLQTQAGSAPLPLHDWTDELDDFAETAALVAGLDLVITVDTAVAHLAGALGRPVWLLNRFAADWRWLRDRDDSPWYPTLRQFRQIVPGDWRPVVDVVEARLSLFRASRDASLAGVQGAAPPGLDPSIPGS